MASGDPPAPPTNSEALGWAVRTLRVAAGKSQRQLAEEAGVDVSWLSRIENGRDTNPRWRTLRSLSAALDVSVSDFVARVVAFEEGELPPPSRSRVRGHSHGA